MTAQVRASSRAISVAKEEPLIVWEDANIAVLSKGAGWIVAISRNLPQNIFYDKALKERGLKNYEELMTSGRCEHLCHYIALKFKDNKNFQLSSNLHYEWGIAHRLDVDTSGAIMIGKSIEGFNHLREAFKTHKVFKEYICLVHGYVQEDHGQVDNPIYWDQATNTSYVSPKGEWARSIYYVIARYRLKGGSKIFSVCRVVIITGRTHQIRLHMASIGHPLVTDNKYSRENYRTDIMWCPRLFLHAWRIGFHNISWEWKEVRVSLAKDLSKALRTVSQCKVDGWTPGEPSIRILDEIDKRGAASREPPTRLPPVTPAAPAPPVREAHGIAPPPGLSLPSAELPLEESAPEEKRKKKTLKMPQKTPFLEPEDERELDEPGGSKQTLKPFLERFPPPPSPSKGTSKIPSSQDAPYSPDAVLSPPPPPPKHPSKVLPPEPQYQAPAAPKTAPRPTQPPPAGHIPGQEVVDMAEMEEILCEKAVKVLLLTVKCQMTVSGLAANDELAPLLQKMGPRRPKLSKLLKDRPGTFHFVGHVEKSNVVELTPEAKAQGRKELEMNSRKDVVSTKAKTRINKTQADKLLSQDSNDYHDKVDQLVRMGYNKDLGLQVLRANHGDMVEAMDQLSSAQETQELVQHEPVKKSRKPNVAIDENGEEIEMMLPAGERVVDDEEIEDVMAMVLEMSKKEADEERKREEVDNQALFAALEDSKRVSLEARKRLEERDNLDESVKKVFAESEWMDAERKRRQKVEDEEMEVALRESVRFHELFHSVDNEQALLDEILDASAGGSSDYPKPLNNGKGRGSKLAGPKDEDEEEAQLRAAIEASYNDQELIEDDSDDDEELVFRPHLAPPESDVTVGVKDQERALKAKQREEDAAEARRKEQEQEREKARRDKKKKEAPAPRYEPPPRSAYKPSFPASRRPDPAPASSLRGNTKKSFDNVKLREHFDKKLKASGLEFDGEVLYSVLTSIPEHQIHDEEVLKMWLGFPEEDTIPDELFLLVAEFSEARDHLINIENIRR